MDEWHEIPYSRLKTGSSLESRLLNKTEPKMVTTKSKLPTSHRGVCFPVTLEHQSWPWSAWGDTQVIQIIRLKEVQLLSGLSKSSIYAKMDKNSPYHDPDWPKSVRLGPRSVGWYRHEIIQWVESRAHFRGWEV